VFGGQSTTGMSKICEEMRNVCESENNNIAGEIWAWVNSKYFDGSNGR